MGRCEMALTRTDILWFATGAAIIAGLILEGIFL